MAKKKDYTWAYVLGTVLLVMILILTFQNKIGTGNDETYSLVPGEAVLSSCQQICTSEGLSRFYDFVNSCNPGETKITYGFSGEDPLLICCCYNEQNTPPVSSCTDSDGGRDRYTPGIVSYNSEGYMDTCLEVGAALTEYWCEGNEVRSENLACDYGEECIQTRSGAYCNDIAPTWSPGDTVFEGSGNGIISGASGNIATLDLSDYGFTPDGTCRLGSQISTQWDYANEYCQGLQGAEGLEWKFYDSAGLEYSRIDPNPTGLGVDLHPEAHILNWDGHTDWRATVEKTIGLPDCEINYEYSIRVYIYDC